MNVRSGLVLGWALCLLSAPLVGGQASDQGSGFNADIARDASAATNDSRPKQKDRASKRKKTPKRNLLAPHERPERPRLA